MAAGKRTPEGLTGRSIHQTLVESVVLPNPGNLQVGGRKAYLLEACC